MYHCRKISRKWYNDCYFVSTAEKGWSQNLHLKDLAQDFMAQEITYLVITKPTVNYIFSTVIPTTISDLRRKKKLRLLQGLLTSSSPTGTLYSILFSNAENLSLLTSEFSSFHFICLTVRCYQSQKRFRESRKIVCNDLLHWALLKK